MQSAVCFLRFILEKSRIHSEFSPDQGTSVSKGTDESDKSIYVQNINDCLLQTHFLKSTDENSEDAVRAVSIQPSPVMLTCRRHGPREGKYQDGCPSVCTCDAVASEPREHLGGGVGGSGLGAGPEGEDRHRREAGPAAGRGVMGAGHSPPRLVRGAERRVDLPLSSHKPDKCGQRP